MVEFIQQPVTAKSFSWDSNDLKRTKSVPQGNNKYAPPMRDTLGEKADESVGSRERNNASLVIVILHLPDFVSRRNSTALCRSDIFCNAFFKL